MGADTVTLDQRRGKGRHYRILGVLGEGGFGRVYRARLEDDQGFSKEVAIKIGDSNAPEEVLKRFRDEARILGLVRDRAIVNVEPPTRLGSRWAVVMEYVEGASLAQILAARSKLPPRVALAVVQEVARALDSVYSALGPDGYPLHLVHRDLKPGNLQLTRAGEVKILDFGLARARFDGREADSTTNIGGTLGYIAPERLEGIESAKGDVYSLGIVLRTLLTGVGPTRWRAYDESSTTIKDPAELAARAVADWMIEMELDERPSARDVEERCGNLVSEIRGPTLRAWCRDHVRQPREGGTDRLVGSVLSETLASVPTRIEDSQNLVHSSRSRWLWAAGIGSLGTGVIAAIAVALVAIAAILWLLRPVPVEVVEIDIADVMSDPSPAPVEAPPEPVTQKPAPTERPRERRPAVVLPVDFSSDPPGAEVWIDGVLVGTTPLPIQQLPEGGHALRYVFGFESSEAEIVVGPNRPTRYLWEVGEPLQVSY